MSRHLKSISWNTENPRVPKDRLVARESILEGVRKMLLAPYNWKSMQTIAIAIVKATKNAVEWHLELQGFRATSDCLRYLKIWETRPFKSWTKLHMSGLNFELWKLRRQKESPQGSQDQEQKERLDQFLRLLMRDSNKHLCQRVGTGTTHVPRAKQNLAVNNKKRTSAQFYTQFFLLYTGVPYSIPKGL